MKIQWGNIDKTEDKIIRVDGVESEETSTPFNDILWVNRLLPPLSILQLSDVWLKTKKTFKGKAGKVLVVWPEEKSIEFWDWGWWWNVTPITLTYEPELIVDLWNNLNYILTLTGDCTLTLTNIIQCYEYQFLIIQDNVWWHTLNIAHPCYYQVWYTQDTTPNSHSKLIIDKINNEYYASISKYEQLIANITWEDYDWTVLDTSTTPYGDTPIYSWLIPTRAWYTFVWWTPSLWPVFWDITYTATYEWWVVPLTWIFWNQNDWLISISDDWTNWITMQDKNRWATQVFEFSSQTFTSATCWDYLTYYDAIWYTPPTWFHMWTNTDFNSVITMWLNLWAWREQWWLWFSTYLKMPCAWKYATNWQLYFVWLMWSYYVHNDLTPENTLLFDTYIDTVEIKVVDWWTATRSPIRYVKDTPVIPDATRTRLY